MTPVGKIDVRDREAGFGSANVVIPETCFYRMLIERGRISLRVFFLLRNSPLTWKILVFNLAALNVLVAGLLYLNSSQTNFSDLQFAREMAEAKHIAENFEIQVRGQVPADMKGGKTRSDVDIAPSADVLAAFPIMQSGKAVGAVSLISASNRTGGLPGSWRIFQMFLLATLVSIALSLVLASTIALPLADLAKAAEIGGTQRGDSPGEGRVRIPDLTARTDEIGRLSGALRGMVAALYHRIDSNEQFAADVAHEVKNPLASLRSAVDTLSVAKRDDQRDKLLEVIKHDVRRLDRLVSDISSASRLDSELVKEQQEPFDLMHMLDQLSRHMRDQAAVDDIGLITDFPTGPIIITGLEARLAQVFVNLISNACSFCESGDAIRVWARRRGDRMLIVVEDTGPGIPDQALTKIFQRFYSQREPSDFGNNSGLGLAISKQIVEAHGGVIWAENIRPTEADITSDPLGARFIVGLPI